MEDKIKIAGKEFSILRLPLRGWAKLESIKKKMDEAIKSGNTDLYADEVEKFLEVTTSPKIEWEKVPWFEFVEILNLATVANSPTLDFPILNSKEESKPLPWEYEGRAWYFWYDLFARNYGWDAETIGNLDIDDAIGLYQEISINDQLNKEWEWGLSEMAYPYDKNTKKSRFQPLGRPSWMTANLVPATLPVVKMLKAHMPMGNIVDVSNLT